MTSAGLAGRRALVTGSSRGIGRAIAEALAAAGAQVCINASRSADEAAAAAAAVTERGGEAMTVMADVSDAEQVAAMFGQIKERWGGVDVLVNNAAETHDGYLMMLSEAAWDRVLATNLRGAFLCCKHAVRSMIAARWGRVVNIVSPAGVLGKDGAANYAASKGGLLAMSRSLAREVARYGITVNAVCPGLIDTQLVAALPPALRAQYLDQIPLRRFGTAEEVADAVAFLASERARYITGVALSVDGGLTML